MGSEFQLVRLDEVCRNVSRPFPLKTKEKVIFVNTGDVSQGKFLHYNYSDVDSLPGQAKKAILTGDILFSEIRPINGRFAKVELENTGDFVVSTKFMVIDLITNTMNRDFFYLQLTSKKTLEEFQKIAESRSGTFPQITFDAIAHYPIYKPELETQQTISSWLLSVERKLKLNRELNETLEQMAQALFNSWFVDFDPVIDNALAAGNPIPDELQERAQLRKSVIAQRTTNPKLKPLPHNIQQLFPSEFEESELGWIPKGWEVSSVHDIVDTISHTYKLKEVDKVIFLNTGDIEDGRFLHNNYSATEGLPGQAKKSITRGDILYSEIRPKNKRFALVNFDAKDYVVSTKLMVLRAKEGIDSLLPYFILTQEKTIQNLQHVAEHRSGTFPQITFKELANVTATLPKAKTLIDYFVSDYLKPFYDKQFSSIAQNEQLEKLRDTLLPKLISGEVTLNKDVA